VHKGDKVIIVAYATYSEQELKSYKPTVVLLNDDNNIDEIVESI
jgi:aspartate 1-decarboxylase